MMITTVEKSDTEKILDELKQELKSTQDESRWPTDDQEDTKILDGKIYAYETAIEIVEKYLKK